MQFLVDCADKSVCIIYKRSIIPSDNYNALLPGEKIKFFWPEDSIKAKEYEGTIVAADYREEPLMELFDKIVKKRSQKKTTINEKRNEPLKKDIRLGQKQIFEEIFSEKSNQFPAVYGEFDWLANEIDEIKTIVTTEMKTLESSILNKLEVVLAVTFQEKRKQLQIQEAQGILKNAETNDQKNRRSYGMDDTDEKENENKFNTNSIEPELEKSIKLLVDKTVHEKRRSYGMDNDDENKQKNKFKETDNIKDKSSKNYEMPFEIIKSAKKRKNAYVILSDDDESSSQHSNNLALECENDNIMNKKQKIDLGPTDLNRFTDDDWMDKDYHWMTDKTQSLKDFSPKNKIIKPSAKSLGDKNTLGIGMPSTSFLTTSKMDFKKMTSCSWNSTSDLYSSYENNYMDEESNETKHKNIIDDKKWTLKYSTGDDKVKELIVGSGVYINVYDLIKLKNTTSKSTELARGLFKAIFTDAALKTCSLTGSRPKGSKKESEIRPGLHDGARDTIITYAKKYGEKNNWEIQSAQQIKSSVRSMLQELKAAKKIETI